MNRKLSYTPEGFAARVRMSKEHALFIVMEGRDVDTPFYEGLAKSSSKVVKRGYQTWLIEQITRSSNPSDPPPSGGKAALMSLFDNYKSSGFLAAKNSSGKKAVIFCADRDGDDIAKVMRRSPHLIYTPMADAETTIFAFSNQKRALARAASISESDAASFLLHHPDWMSELADRWRVWVELCCIAAAHHAHCHLGSTKISTVNINKFEPAIDPDEVARAKQVIARKSQFPANRHVQIERRVSERLNRLYASGGGKRLIGKHWAIEFLIHLLRAHFGSAPISITTIKHRATTAFLGELDFNAGWASVYRRKFDALI